MKKIALVGAVALLFVKVSYGACSNGSCSNVKVERLYIDADSVLLIGTDGDETQLNCTPHSDVYIVLSPTETNFNPIYSALLAAQISGRVITVRITDGSSPCRVAYVVLKDQ